MRLKLPEQLSHYTSFLERVKDDGNIWACCRVLWGFMVLIALPVSRYFEDDFLFDVLYFMGGMSHSQTPFFKRCTHPNIESPMRLINREKGPANDLADITGWPRHSIPHFINV